MAASSEAASSAMLPASPPAACNRATAAALTSPPHTASPPRNSEAPMPSPRDPSPTPPTFMFFVSFCPAPPARQFPQPSHMFGQPRSLGRKAVNRLHLQIFLKPEHAHRPANA